MTESLDEARKARDLQDRVLARILDERRAQDRKWGQENHCDLYWLGIIMEEVGEAADRLTAARSSDTSRLSFLAARIGAMGREAKAMIEDMALEALDPSTIPGTSVDAAEVDGELTQVAAVAVAWMEHRVRRRLAAAEAREPTWVEVDLEKYRTGGCRVFAGRERGRLIRAATKLADADRDGVDIDLKIPADVYSLGYGFVVELLGPSLKARGMGAIAHGHVRIEGPEIVVRNVLTDLQHAWLRNGWPS